jgi:DNA-binding MarR family transcriptional regulator
LHYFEKEVKVLDSVLKEQLIKAMIHSKKMLMITTAGSGVPFAEIAMLMHIFHLSSKDSEGCGVRVMKIKDQTHISLPAVSQQLRALEQKGLVERNTTANDRRITLVSLTPAGCEAIKRINEHTDQILGELVLKVGEDNIQQYVLLSQTIMKSLEEMTK